MSYLLDTNVVSEWTRPQPDTGVLAWLGSVDEDELHLSVATIAELRFGIALLPSSARQQKLAHWFQEELLSRFSGRILSIDGDIATSWGEVRAERQKAGRPISAMDAVIAATARVYGLSLVTRNSTDFAGSLPGIINPWGAI
jgi:hypothetical protein